MCTSGSSSDLDAMLVHVRGLGPVVACKCRRDRAKQLESTGTRMSRTIGGGASVCQELDTGSMAPPGLPAYLEPPEHPRQSAMHGADQVYAFAVPQRLVLAPPELVQCIVVAGGSSQKRCEMTASGSLRLSRGTRVSEGGGEDLRDTRARGEGGWRISGTCAAEYLPGDGEGGEVVQARDDVADCLSICSVQMQSLACSVWSPRGIGRKDSGQRQRI